VKVLGASQLYNQLEVTADAFTDVAREVIEAEGGEAVLSERGQERAAQRAADGASEEDTTDDSDSGE
jgi:large subunit ribosomal protein L15